MRTEFSVEIDRPIDEVFEFTIEHVAEWSSTVVEDEVIDEKPDYVGTTFRCLTMERGQRMEFLGTVTRHEPPRVSTAYLVGPSFDIDVEYTFEEISGGTRVTQRSSIKGKGITKMVLFLMGWLMKKSACKAVAAELDNLKRILEERAGEVPA